MKHPYLRTLVWFDGAALCLVSVVGAPLLHSLLPFSTQFWNQLNQTKSDLTRLGLENKIDSDAINDLVEYQRITGRSLAQILQEPNWISKFGYSSQAFKATWYISNPFELLPPDLQQAIRDKKTPFKTSAQVWEWCRVRKAPPAWKKALKAALIETTPHNLWRAARGGRPYTKSGEFIKPIVVEQPEGTYDTLDGHIATDPRVIPTNSVVLLLVRINGKEQILKVKAADIGGMIKGKHVDLPIQLHAKKRNYLPNVILPQSQIRNPVVQILIPKSPKPNLNQKA